MTATSNHAGPVAAYRSPFAGLRIRALAAALDLTFVWLVAAAVEVLARIDIVGWGAAALAAGLAVVYFAVLWGIAGWSLGQRVLGLEVVRAADGEPIDMPMAATRVAGCLVAAAPLALGLLWVGWDLRKQGWHDKIAGTVVIHQ